MSDTNSKQRLSRTVLDYDGLAIGVSVGRSADREWLSDFLAPAFSVSARRAADVEVHFAVDRERFAELERRGPAASGGVVDGLVLDDSTLRFERWANAPEVRGPNGKGSQALATQTAFDPHFGVFYEVTPGPAVRITADTRERCRIPLMRVVREFAMHACLRGGDLFVHAASLCVDGKAIIIAGRKLAGKTTTLTWSLQLLENARFISNDRVRLRSSAKGFDVRGMPTLMSFRPQSLELLPELDSAIRAERGSYQLSPSEARERNDLPPLEPWSDGRLGLSPSRYAELLGRRSVASAPAGALVFPEIVADDSGLRAIAIDPDTAEEHLGQALFGVTDLQRRSELFDLPAAGPFPSQGELRARARRIVEAVPCYVWKVGSSAPRDSDRLMRFVQEMSRGCSS